MPYVVKKQNSQYCVFKKGSSSPIKGGCHKTKGDADKHRDALNINVKSALGFLEQQSGGVVASSTETFLIENIAETVVALKGLNGAKASAIQALQDSVPQLTTRTNIQIIKTGIEYPLSTGPTTFTPEDLADAVASQDDPWTSAPRIWLGHPDDPRIHGQRYPGGPPSGEPAVGRVTNMRLEDEGNTIVGDLEGIPVWLDRILASAFPSRSIEANFDVKTERGNWRLVISGLALLGVVWPGVASLEDIASLYTPDGPDDVKIIEATQERPVTTIEASARTVTGQVTVEDLRREFYDGLNGDQAWWWIRAIYLDPNELIVDDDDGGLFRVGFNVKGEEISFDDPKSVKVKYVNASNGAVSTEPINAGRTHVAVFASREESRPEGDADPAAQSEGVVVDLNDLLASSVHVNIQGGTQ